MGSYTPRSYFDDLARHFTPLESREIVLLAAWQAAGLRAIASWRREESLDSTLPLAYLDMREGEDTFLAYTLAPEATPDPELAQQLYDRYVGEWATTAGPPAAWAAYLREAPHVFWGWAEFHRIIVTEGLNDRRVKGGVIAYLAALEGHQGWAMNVAARPELWGLSSEEVGALSACDLSGFDHDLQAVLRYVEEMTYSSGVSTEATDGIRAVLSPGQLVELGMFAGLHLASIRIDMALRAGEG
jgi:hypothetical protein